MIRIPGLKGVNPSLNCSGLMTLFRCDIVPVCDAAILPGKDIENSFSTSCIFRPLIVKAATTGIPASSMIFSSVSAFR